MMNAIANLIIKIIPTNWVTEYVYKCNVERICETILNLKWYAWLSIFGITFIVFGSVLFLIVFLVKNIEKITSFIKNIRSKQ
jgi:hypothetical protein